MGGTRTGGCSLAPETEKCRSLSPDCAGLGLMTELKPLTRVCISTDGGLVAAYVYVLFLQKEK